MKKSRNHSEARFEDGSYVCSLCGAESLDFELFEEAGEDEDCLARGVEAGTVPDPNDVVDWAKVEQSRKWIEEARASFVQLSKTATVTTRQFEELSKMMKKYEAATAEYKRLTEVVEDND